MEAAQITNVQKRAKQRTQIAYIFPIYVLAAGLFLQPIIVVLIATLFEGAEAIGLMLFIVTIYGPPSLLIAYYAKRLDHPAWMVVGISGAVPVFRWAAYFNLMLYERTDEEVSVYRSTGTLPLWVVAIFFSGPILLGIFLTIINPGYMSQLIVGAPVGATFPIINIPVGWIILLILIGLMTASTFILLVGFAKPQLYIGGMPLLTVVTVFLLYMPVQLWLVMFGPAMVQLMNQFLG